MSTWVHHYCAQPSWLRNRSLLSLEQNFCQGADFQVLSRDDQILANVHGWGHPSIVWNSSDPTLQKGGHQELRNQRVHLLRLALGRYTLLSLFLSWGEPGHPHLFQRTKQCFCDSALIKSGAPCLCIPKGPCCQRKSWWHICCQLRL